MDRVGGPKDPKDARLPEVIYVNGYNCKEAAAAKAASALSEQLRSPVRLCWNDLTNVVVDFGAAAVEKVFPAALSANAATATLKSTIRARIEAGEHVYLVGHSAGSACIANAVEDVADDYDDEVDDGELAEKDRDARLGRIHVLCVGGIVDPRHWPKGVGSVHDLYDRRDPVADMLGAGATADMVKFDCADRHGSSYYLKHIRPEMLERIGHTAIE